LPKHERARLHEAFADWMESRLASRINELHEVVGYHLEQACLYLRSVGGASDAALQLSRRAAAHLAAGAERAHARGDLRALNDLLARAVGMLPAGDLERARLLPRVADALQEVGRLDEAHAAVEEVLATPGIDEWTRASALELVELGFLMGLSAAELEPNVDEALAIRRALGEPGGLARALNAKGRLLWFRGELAAANAPLREALPLAQEVGDVDLEAQIRERLVVSSAMSRLGGKRDPAPNLEMLEFARAHGLLLYEASGIVGLAMQAGHAGDRDGALRLIEQKDALLADLGTYVWNLGRYPVAAIHEWHGDTEAAILELERGVRNLQQVGERGYLSSEASSLALLLLDAERVAEASEAVRIAKESGAADDTVTQSQILAAEARIAARDGDLAAAERLARAAAAEADAAEYLISFTYSRLALADVLRLAGRSDEAAAYLEEAAATEERRGNKTYAATIRRRATK
jgi:tetratricopeptide (TPR) repeat protein